MNQQLLPWQGKTTMPDTTTSESSKTSKTATRKDFLIKKIIQPPKTSPKITKRTKLRDQVKQIRKMRMQKLNNTDNKEQLNGDTEMEDIIEEFGEWEDEPGQTEKEITKIQGQNQDKTANKERTKDYNESENKQSNIEKLRQTIVERENASVTAIERLTQILVKTLENRDVTKKNTLRNMKLQYQRPPPLTLQTNKLQEMTIPTLTTKVRQ